MTPVKRYLSVGLAAATTLGMGAVAFVSSPTALAAPTTVTIPEPAMSSLDPAIWGGQILIDQGTIFEGLFGYNRDNQVVPKIASHWSVTDGGRVWTIWLRHNARWSNGQPVTANDFYFAWMRLASPQDTTGALWAGVMTSVVNAWAYHAGTAPASSVGLKVLGPYEIQLTLSGPQNIEGLLALSGSMPLYPPDVEQHPTNWYLPQYFVGDGPYIVKSFVTNGEVQLVRNPYYVGAPGEYNVGNVQQINLIPAPTVPVEDYEANTIDAGMIGSPSDYVYVLQHMRSQVHVAPAANINYLEFDKSPQKSPLDNQLVREAIAMAIDRGPIANPVLNNMVGVTDVPAYPGWPTWGMEHNPYTFNVKKARELLAKAGYPNGRGIGTLYLYCQTQTSSPPSVSMAEAIAQELKSELNINFKIEPTNSTLWGALTWQGMEQGVLPGYNIATGVANWDQVVNWPIQINQWIANWVPGVVGPPSYRQYFAQIYFNQYDPTEVKEWGNPNDPNMGTSFSQWQPLIKAAEQAIPYLNAWMKKQPALYQEIENPPGTVPATTVLQNYINSYKTATTPAAKHAAWVNFWKWVGSYSTGLGDISVGLVDQVWMYQHEPQLQYEVNLWATELSGTTSNQQAKVLTAKIANAILQSAYVVPLNYVKLIYLEKPWLHHLQANPWSWNNFYQLQYMTVQ